MQFNWNILGILIWITIIVGFILMMKNIRHRHLKMIVIEQVTFSWKNFLIDTLEIVAVIAAAVLMTYLSFFKNPDLTNQKSIANKIEYQSLILTPGKDRSYYVDAETKQGSNPRVRFNVLSDGQKLTIDSRNSAVSAGVNPLSVQANSFPFDKATLLKKDKEYQKAYLAIYEGKYKNTPMNGLGLHVGKVARKYYLIRIPDETFYHETVEETK